MKVRGSWGWWGRWCIYIAKSVLISQTPARSAGAGALALCAKASTKRLEPLPEAIFFSKILLSNGATVLRMHVKFLSIKYTKPKLIVFYFIQKVVLSNSGHPLGT